MRLQSAANMLVVLGLSLGPTSAIAGGCGAKVDLTEPGRSMHDAPTFVQDGNSCSAYSAAAMADAWRRSHPPAPAGFPSDFITSGMKLYKDMLGKGLADLAGTLPDAAIDYLRKNPACDQRFLYGTDPRLSPGRFADRLKDIYAKSIAATQTTEGRAEIHKIYEGVLARHPNATPEFIGLQGMYEWNLKHGYAQQLCEALAGMDAFVPTGNFSSVDYLAAFLARESPDAFLGAYLKKACEARSPQSKIPEAQLFSTTDDKEILAKINKALDSPNPQPVAVSYCSSVLVEKRPYSARFHTLKPFKLAYQNGCEQSDIFGTGKTSSQEHTSVILGRRQNAKTGECEFLLRNTWGVNCDVYKVLPAKWDCQNTSDIWISQSDLAHNTYAVTLFKTEL